MAGLACVCVCVYVIYAKKMGRRPDNSGRKNGSSLLKLEVDFFTRPKSKRYKTRKVKITERKNSHLRGTIFFGRLMVRVGEG